MALCPAMFDDDDDTPTTGEVVDPLADTPGEWLTIEKAADRLACHQRTIWREITRGKLRRRRVGRAAEVFVPRGMPPLGTPSSDMVPATADTPDTLALAVIDELRTRREQDAAIIERLTDGTTRQAEEIGKLKAERDAAEARAAQLAEALAAERARPWYRRWW
jgi:excisionase family DNA binding protein